LCDVQQLRAQVPVLKKAVLDEQANEEQLKVTCAVTKLERLWYLNTVSVMKFYMHLGYTTLFWQTLFRQT